MKEEQLKKLFGKRVRAIRKSKNLTQEKLSEMTDMDPQHFCKMENGTHFPSPKNLVKIANALNVEIKELFTFTADKDENLEKIFLDIKNLSDKELEFIQSVILSMNKLNEKQV